MATDEKGIDHEQEQSELKAGKRVKEFLGDPHVKAAIARRQAELAADIFRKAKTEEQVLELWHEGKALESALDALKVTADRGEKVELDRAERDRLALRQTPRSR